MNKVIPLVAASLLATSTAFAQTAPAGLFPAAFQPTFSTYGLIDLSAGRSETGSGTTLPGAGVPGPASQTVYRLDSGLGFGSRLGFKAAQDLGGGLTAKAQLEMGLAADTGALNQGGLIFGRQVFLGVWGKDWSVSAGRQYPLMTFALGDSEALVGGYWGSIYGEAVGTYESIGSTAGNGSYQGGSRQDNSVQVTKTIGPVTGYAMVGAGNENARHTGAYWSLATKYQQGPLKAFVVYANVRQNAEQIIATATPEWQKEIMVGGSYDFGPFALYTGYFQFNGPKNKANLSPVATVGAPGAAAQAFSWNKNQIAWAGVRVPISTGSFITSVGLERYPYSDKPEGRSTLIGVAYEYYLSDHATTFVSYGQVENNATARTPLYGATTIVGPNGFGADPSAASVGIRFTW